MNGTPHVRITILLMEEFRRSPATERDVNDLQEWVKFRSEREMEMLPPAPHPDPQYISAADENLGPKMTPISDAQLRRLPVEVRGMILNFPPQSIPPHDDEVLENMSRPVEREGNIKEGH